ncbi:hypothetical protein DFH27DRAFT_278031 [Peziza echinospora]|nr:hypothetical protein DFH27DRAFT_278031 [Peziza echinospora]
MSTNGTSTLHSTIEKGTIVCRPTDWIDIVKFLLLNYVAHAFTTLTLPGEPLSSILFKAVSALFCPYFSLMGGTSRVFDRGYTANCTDGSKDSQELNTAAHGNACFTLVVGHYTESGKFLADGPTEMLVKSSTIHGAHDLSESWPSKPPPFNGHENASSPDTPPSCSARDQMLADEERGPASGLVYRLMPLRLDSLLIPMGLSCTRAADAPLVLSSSSNTGTAVVAILQVGFAVYGLYTVRASQLERFGYAAYVFTVIPFALMSVLNLAQLIGSPAYPAGFLLHYGAGQWTLPPDCGITVEDINAKMGGAIGSFEFRQPDKVGRIRRIVTNYAWAIILAVFIIAPFAVIACFTHFDAKQSTSSERGLAMAWLASTPLSTFFFGYADTTYDKIKYCLHRGAAQSSKRRLNLIVQTAIWAVLAFIPGIGGYVAVIMMLRRDETCIRI